jgi:hypothetical protein
MPNDLALQVFYGTIPIILMFAGLYVRKERRLKDILARVRGLEKMICQLNYEFRAELSKIKERARCA